MSSIKKAQNHCVKKATLDPDPLGTALKILSEKHPEVMKVQKEIEEIEDKQFSYTNGNCNVVITGNGIIKSFKAEFSQFRFPVQFKNPEELHQWVDRIIAVVNEGTIKAAQKRASLRNRLSSTLAAVADKE